jgi:uncharacterized protein
MTAPEAMAPPPPTGAPRSTEPPASYVPPRPAWFAEPQDLRWGIPSALIPWGVLALLVAAQFAVAPLLRAGHVRLPREPTTFAIALGAYAAVAVAGVLVLRLGRGGGLRDIGFAFRPLDLALGLAGFVAVEIVRAVLGAVAVLIVGTPSHGNLEVGPSPLWFALDVILVAGLIAPVIEEAITRGLLLRAVRTSVLRRGLRRGDDPDDRRLQVRAAVVSVAVSSGVFVLAHLYEGWDDARVVLLLIVTTLPMAIVAGWLAIATRRLGAGIVMHVLINMTAGVVAFATLPR